MDREAFWGLIERSRAAAGKDNEQQEQTLKGWLDPLRPQELLSFDYHLRDAPRRICGTLRRRPGLPRCGVTGSSVEPLASPRTLPFQNALAGSRS